MRVEAGREDLPQPAPSRFGPVPRVGITELRVERGRRVSGRVLDPDGTPLLGAWTYIEEEDLFRESVRTGLDGRFALPGIPRNRAVHVIIGHDAFEHARLTPPAGPTDDDIDVTMRFPESVWTRGRLRLPPGEELRGEKVIANPKPPFPEHVLPHEQSAEVGSDGSFAFPSAEGVRYRLTLHSSGRFAERLGPEDIVLAGSPDVAVAAMHGVSITGRVADRWGPLPNALLRFRNTSNDDDVARAKTGEGGAFEVRGLEPGATYAVSYMKSGDAPDWLDLPPVAAGTTEVLFDVP